MNYYIYLSDIFDLNLNYIMVFFIKRNKTESKDVKMHPNKTEFTQSNHLLRHLIEKTLKKDDVKFKDG